MKGLNLKWEVSLRSNELYYCERGDTPQEALLNLRDAITKGIAAATEEIEIQQRRLVALTAHLEEMGVPST